jgi:hypothetical protein
MFAATKSGKLPVSGDITISTSGDLYFSNVPLLLNTTSTNGQQNNTFLDSSPNNFSITRNGTPTQGSITPYWPNKYWSNYFNGSSYLTVVDNVAFQPGSGNFTFESWVYPLSLPTSGNYKTFWVQRSTTAAFGGAAIVIDSTGTFQYFISNSAANGWQVSGSSTGFSVTLNSWQHIALTRSGNTLTFYKNGVAGTTATVATGAIGTSGNLSLMAGSAAGGQTVDGYMSNFRMVKGTAVYTGTFRPPESPLSATQSAGTTNIVAITGTATSLLTCQSNRFQDNSVNNFSPTVNGTPRVQVFHPFSPNVSYTTAAYGGSGYFNGSTDYLTIPASTNFAFGTGDFTVEGWFYTTASANQGLWDNRLTSTSTTGFACRLLATTNTLRVIFNNAAVFTTTQAVPLNQWNHIAIVRYLGFVTAYLNGTAMTGGSGTASTPTATDTNMWIGKLLDAGYFYNGYISNFRVVKGTPVYTGTFTPPTTPVTAIPNPSLLLNFTNAGIYDAAVQNNAITVGSAQASTTQSKWSPTSMSFNGSTDYLTIPANAAFALSGDFTIEMWVYPTAAIGAYRALIATGGSGSTDQFGIGTDPSILGIYCAGVASGNSVVPAVGVWTHVAVSRTGNSVYFFLNGIQQGTTKTSSSAALSGSATVSIGYRAASGDSVYTGYIQDLRITRGFARYTSFFTPPTAALPTVGAYSTQVEYLVVGGGGSGAQSRAGYYTGGGGGAGGMITGTGRFGRNITLTVTVGGGGSLYTDGNSSLFDTITAGGGGAGGGGPAGGTSNGNAGNPGNGSGGGATGGVGALRSGGAGSGSGNSGGNGVSATTNFGAGGGGGAGAVGGDGVDVPTGGAGGIGLQSSITGTATYYAGGGGGSSSGAGGAGGGGTAAATFNATPTGGSPNTGGGGGAGSRNGGAGATYYAGSLGGSGIVVIAILSSQPVPTISGGLTYDQPTRTGFRVYRFTAGTGTITFN